MATITQNKQKAVIVNPLVAQERAAVKTFFITAVTASTYYVDLLIWEE